MPSAVGYDARLELPKPALKAASSALSPRRGAHEPMTAKKTHLLLILDGWGRAPDDYPPEKNAIRAAQTPYWDRLLASCPNTTIGSSGNAVGLPEGIMGNSEVGHLNLGAGRIVWQEITRIDKAIEKDGLLSREPLRRAVEKARDAGSTLHLMGLVSDGGVHSIDRHYFALLRLAKRLGLPSDRVLFHCYLDGRDTPPRSGVGYVRELEEMLRAEDLGRIAVVSGRYWAMDRDKRWDRVKRAYDALVFSQSDRAAASGVEAVEKAYACGENDEFVSPTVIESAPGRPIGCIESGDQIVFFNFRPDRTRQLSHAFVDEEFAAFERNPDLKVELTTMTQYEDGLNAAVAFPPADIARTLGDYAAGRWLRQLRIAETEKYAHVTYFFSGGREAELPNETRILVQSPKVATYDLKPEMSLPEVAERLEQEIRSHAHDLIVANFANGDMVGHTGVLEAAIQAAQAVDAALARVIPALLEEGGCGVLTSDHGNCEQMWNFEEDCPNTQHTTTPTPCVLIDDSRRDAQLRPDGCLADVAPTMLELMNLDQPEEMTGASLLVRKH